LNPCTGQRSQPKTQKTDIQHHHIKNLNPGQIKPQLQTPFCVKMKGHISTCLNSDLKATPVQKLSPVSSALPAGCSMTANGLAIPGKAAPDKTVNAKNTSFQPIAKMANAPS
jgi:hypothetical protein